MAVTSIRAGYDFSIGLKSAGAVWCWGFNTLGQLGDNTSTNKSSPVSVVGAHSFTSISAGSGASHIMALKTTGDVWCWGLGISGQLGDNTITTKSSPVSVVGAHSFVAISAGSNHSVGLKSTGDVWCWGLGTSGQLGDNTITTKSSPVLVVSLVGNIKYLTGIPWPSAKKINNIHQADIKTINGTSTD